MRFYVATNFANWKAAKSIQSFLERRGFVVTSRWIAVAEKREGIDETQGAEDWSQQAVRDIEDIDKAEVLVIIPPFTRGAMFELGYSYAKNKLCIIVGDPDHVFHHHPNMILFATKSEFIDWTNSFNTEEIICG